jgi:hypothetical protein
MIQADDDENCREMGLILQIKNASTPRRPWMPEKGPQYKPLDSDWKKEIRLVFVVRATQPSISDHNTLKWRKSRHWISQTREQTRKPETRTYGDAESLHWPTGSREATG